MKQTRVVRSATLMGYVKAAEDVGIDAHSLLKQVNLKADLLENPDRFIPADAFFRLLELSAEASGNSNFGLRAAIARGIPDLGPVSLLLREEETLEDALRTFTSRLHLHSDSTFIELDVRFDKPFLSFRFISNVSTVQGAEFCACSLVQNIRWLVGADWNPDAVCYTHSRPSDTTLQRKFFRSALRHDQLLCGIMLAPEALKLKVATSPEVLRRHAKKLIERSLTVTTEDFAVQVSRLITQLLPDSRCSAEQIAISLGIDRRTLSRRLADKGISYSLLLQEVRREVAQNYAANAHYSMMDAAEATGFNTLAAFSRWFHATFGCSATLWRAGRRNVSPDATEAETPILQTK